MDQRPDLGSDCLMDDATGEHYHMQFVEEEGTRSSFQGVQAVIRQHGIFSAIYTDRGSHYWFTPEVGGKVDRERPTQFGRAMQQLGIEMIAAYSPQRRADAPNVPSVPTRIDWCASSPPSASRTCRRPTVTCASSICPSSTASSRAGARGRLSLRATGLDRPEGDPVRALRAYGATRQLPASFEGTVLQIPQQRHRCNFVKTKVARASLSG